MQSPTPQTSEYELVAQISKTKGLEGQLVAQEVGRLSVLRVGLEVWIVPPTLEGVRHSYITELEANKQKNGLLISLEGVTDRTQAGELAGRYLLAKTAGQDKGESSMPDEQDLLQEDSAIALVFTDTNYGNLGKLDHIKPGTAYDIWVILGPYGRLDIPAVDEYVVEEDEETMQLSLPPGFIEITGEGKKGDARGDAGRGDSGKGDAAGEDGNV